MPDSNLAPGFELSVQNTKLDIGLSQLIEKVEFESIDGMADAAKVTAKNPNFMLSKAKAFQPGNEMNLYAGYGAERGFIGRFVVVKQRPNYPESGYPSIQIVGYTKDQRMMANSPKKSKGENGKHGRRFDDATYSTVVEEVAATYGFSVDVDDTGDSPRPLIQKVGVSDYQFIAGLANITGFIFWVDGDEDGNWTLHFKDPQSPIDQEKKYTFNYNSGNASTLLTFSPEMLIQEAFTELTVSAKNPRTGKLLTVTIEEESREAPDLDASEDPAGQIEGSYTTASDVKLYIKDFSFDAVSNRRFTSAAELEAWARQWFRRHRENFITGNGNLVGIESLRARQVHALANLGGPLDGDYYFSRVRHMLSDGGYTCEFTGRKVVPEL